MTLRAYIAGMTHETNTFSPIPTSAENFSEVYRPSGAYAPPPHIDTLGYGHFAQHCLDAGVEVVPGLFTHASPSAPLVARDYAAFKAEIVDGLKRAGRVDMVFLFMHGAQVAQGCDDVEGDILAAVRAVVGRDVPLGIELDLHANVSRGMLQQADLVIGCLEYPHTDYAPRTAQMFGWMQALQQRRVQPRTLAWRLPLMGLYRTTEGSMKRFVAALRAAEAEAGILAISAFHGFFLADVPDACGCLVVVAESPAHEAKARAVGERLARDFIDAALAMPKARSMADALDEALASTQHPVVLADSGDNPGGGAAGDSTWVLKELLDRGVAEAAFGMLWDPMAVDFAHRAGVGASLKLRLGGKVSALSGPPLDVQAEVTCLRTDARQAWFAQGEPKALLGRSAALRVQGIDIVVNTERQQVFDPRCFTEHGIDPARKRLVVVKGSTHFANGFAPLAGKIIYCASPGSVALDPALFPLTRAPRPMFPIDPGYVPVAHELGLGAR